MQNASVNFVNTLKQSVSLSSTARLIAEWDMNRFAAPVSIVNTGVTDGDSDEFPLDSIVAPNRPARDGIQKARVVSTARWVAAGKSLTAGNVSAMYTDVNNIATQSMTKKGYVASADDKYVYWSSSTPSGTTLASGGYALTNGVLELTYSVDFWCNKIVVGFEATAAAPKDVTFSYKETSGGPWIDIAGTFQIDGNGQIIIYRTSAGTWTTTEDNTSPLKIRAVRVTVPRMSRASSYLNVIQVSARLQTDLSDYITEYSVNNTMSEPSLVTPLGTCSSNEADLTLSNIDGRFDNDRMYLLDTNIPNLFYGIIDKNIQMRMDLGLKVNGTTEWVRQFTMWTDEWGAQGEDTAQVSLKDSSKILQEAKPNESLYQGLSTAGIVWRMCDSIGFNNYIIPATALNDNATIDFFWTDAEKSVWEHFQDMAQATQTAIFFDEYDMLKVLPRASAYNLGNPVSWTFDGEQVPTNAPDRPTNDYGKLADIIELTQNYDFEANTVNVKYTPTAVSKMVGTIPVMEQVWEPGGDVVLRASRLTQTMLNTARSFRITPAEAKYWPYQGIIQVEGEFIKYVGKGYTYRNAAGTWLNTYIKSEEERVKLDALNPTYAFANYFNGYMDCLGGRGMWGTTAATHYVDISGWTNNRVTYTVSSGNAPTRNWNGGVIHMKDAGRLRLQTNNAFKYSTWYTATRGSTSDSPPYWYGTRIIFPKTGNTYGAAGMTISTGDYDNGFYIELIRTDKIAAANRKYSNELAFYVKYNNGSIKRFGPNGGAGIPMQILPGVYYDIDVHFEWQGTDRIVSIMVNGVTRMQAVVPTGSGTGQSIGGRYGFFTRGDTCAEFEYIYASTNAINDAFDQEGWFDRVRGGFQSSQYDREWTYGWKTNTRVRKYHVPVQVKGRYNSRMMDEFGPVVHEVREYDVKFEKNPVIHSNLYISNDQQVICPEYTGTPFGASFVLANTARVNAIVNGNDTLTFGVNNPVDQKMLIYGRLVTKEEEATETVKDTNAINRRGVVEIDVQSDWIQSKSTAQALGAWITQHWAGGCDELDLSVTGNPLLQLGDLVALNYADKAFGYLTHRYFVVSVNHSYDGGLDTRVKLRRAKV